MSRKTELSYWGILDKIGLQLPELSIVVPMHKEIDIGTLLEIIRQAGLKREEFLKMLE